jgi:glutathione S-transferase
LPVTAKLSRRFYDQLGDEVANELVNWFNAVDETYRNQLRELNELNWERFRSELRAEGIAIRSDVEKRLSEMDKRLDAGFAAIDARFTAIDARFTAIDGRLSAIDAQFERVEANFPTLEQRIDAKFARCEARMYKAMFAFWTATIIPLAALILALDGAFQR